MGRKFLLFIFLFMVSCEESLESIVLKADEQVKAGKTEQAIVTYEKGIQQYPKEITLYLNQAALYRGKQMYTRSLRYYRAAGLLNAESPLPLIGEARIGLAQGSLEPSKKILEEALKVAPNHPAAFFFMGRIYQYQLNGNQAVFYYNLALEQKFDPLLIYYYRGQVYDKILTTRDSARADYQAYIQGNGKKIDEVKGWLAQLDAAPLPTSTATSTSTTTNPFDF